MFTAFRGGDMKRTPASAPLKKAKDAVTPAADISESFRRARQSIGNITADLQQVRRHAQSTVKGAQRPAKSK
jgi:hypothetical protein